VGIAIAKATAVAKIRIKQFWAIPLTGKVVAGACREGKGDILLFPLPFAALPR
jgi:hypothetical protein